MDGKKWIAFIFSCLVFLLCTLQHAKAQRDTNRGTVCWPLSYSGITLGVTTGPQVQRLLGEGIGRSDEGHTGGRYYLDINRTATLHVVTYTDRIVGELSIATGIDPEISASERKQATTKWFDPGEGFGNYHALRLGSSKEEVVKNLGKPAEELDPNAWRYYSNCACQLPKYFTLHFDGNRLVKIVLSAPSG